MECQARKTHHKDFYFSIRKVTKQELTKILVMCEVKTAIATEMKCELGNDATHIRPAIMLKLV